MTATAITANREAIREFWHRECNHGGVHEVRIPNAKYGPLRLRSNLTYCGYFNDEEDFVKEVQRISGDDAQAVYVSLNPVNPDLLARRANRLDVAGKGESTSDSTIPRLMRLLIDCDPKRDPYISATDDERQSALNRRDVVHDYLEADGWPEPVMVSESGNGGHLIYAVDLPNEPDNVQLLKDCLNALHALFSDEVVKIDTTTFNPSRITKVPGTVAAKGDNMPDRPWRVATAEYNEPEIVPVDRLRALAAEAPQPEPKAKPAGEYTVQAGQRTWDIRDVLRDAGIGYQERAASYGIVFSLDRCLTSQDHTDGACIIEMQSGALSYSCRHDRCQGKNWADVRDLLKPSRQLATGDDDDLNSFSSFLSYEKAEETRATPTLDHAALYGLAGDVVRAFDPLTEADRAATLATFLVFFGNAAGRSPHTWVGERRHGLNLAAVICGATSRSRKGTSSAPIERIFEDVDKDWLYDRRADGIGSGEAIVWVIRDASDPKTNPKTGESVVEDEGVRDKRLMIHEEEFSGFLKVAGRDGSIAGETFRKAWDSRDVLRNLVKRQPVKATGPHISTLGHITLDELRRTLTETDQANGVGNRILWVFAQRSKLLPDSPPLDTVAVANLAKRTRNALTTARQGGEVNRDAEAAKLWREVYPELTKDYPGMFGSLTARAEAQVLRLSMVYALLDCSTIVQRKHLFAALAFWQYCEDSARHIFGDRTGDPVADRIRDALRAGPMSETDINNLLGRNRNATRIQSALQALRAAGLVEMETSETGGRPARIWKAVQR